MFKKRKQNLRQRRKSDSDQESEGNETKPETSQPGVTQIWDVKIEPKSSEVKSKKKNKPASDKSQTSVLSFADEEEHESVEEFKIKKSSRSERIARKLKKASRKEKEAEEAAKKQKEEEDRRMKYDYRPQSPESDEGRGSELESEEEEEDGGHKFRSVLESGSIPDANMIHMARKRRQMARDMQDYIPIAETKRNKNTEKSRLIREENDDDDEDDAVPFSEHVHNRERQRMRDEFLAAEHGSDSDSDKETWEAQQIKKAMNIPQVNPSAGQSAVVASYVPGYSTTRDTASPATIKAMYESVDEPAAGSHVPSLASVRQDWDVDQLCQRLHESLSTFQNVHRAHQQEKEKFDEDLALNEKTVKDGELAAPLLEKRYRFFQQTRGYVRDLILCHNEKLPAITELENSYLAMVKERAARRVKRRQQDVKDQATDYNPMKEKRQTPVDTPRQRRAAEREARKGRRRRARESMNIIGHYDGLSTDDEQTQSDLAKFNAERERIRAVRETLYDDVLDEFCQLNKLMEQFEEWKFEHGDSYKEAYIGLCLPKLFSPLVKLELVDWNPLEAASCSMERLSWFSTLIGYGRSATIDSDDVDIKLVPSIIEKFVVPRLTVLAESVWDPLSKQETLLFVSLTERIATQYPVSADSKTMQALVRAIVDRIKTCIDEDIFMPLYPKDVLDKKFSPAATFFSRQLWACIKLFRNTLMWHRVISPVVLKQLTCEAILNRYIILGLSNSINNHLIERCQMIADAIPKAWFEEVSDDATFAELDKFCRFLVNVALNLDRVRASMGEHEAHEARTRVQVIQKLLVNLHAMDHAIEVAHQCSLKLDR